MDAYFTDQYCTGLVPYIKRHGPTKKIKERLVAAGLGVDQALEMAVMKRPYARVLSLMKQHMERRTTQAPKAINALYLDYDIHNFLQQVEKSMNRRNLIRRVELLVERRHKIVHSGDLNGRNRANTVDVLDIDARIQDVRILVHGANAFLVDRFGSVFA